MDHDKLAKLLDKKKGGNLSPIERNAKASVLQHLLADAMAEMGGKLGGLKKVTVASNDTTGLEHGLDKAKELLAAKQAGAIDLPEGEGGEEDDLGAADEGEEGAEDDHEGLSDEGETKLNDDEDGDQDGDMHAGLDGADDEDEHLDEAALDAKLQKLMALKAKLKHR